MEPEVKVFVVSSDGMVRHLPMPSQLLSLLEQLKQQGAKERQEGSGGGATIGELVQVLKRAIHTPEILECENGSYKDV